MDNFELFEKALNNINKKEKFVLDKKTKKM